MMSVERTADVLPIKARDGDADAIGSPTLKDDLLAIEEALDNTPEWKREVHKQAKLLVACGFSVLPVKRLGKGFAGNGMNANAASTESKKIDEWFDPDDGKFAGYNLGIACGARKGQGTVCVDADRHGNGDGVEMLNRLIAAHQPFDKHPWAVTPNNGEHHFFAYSPVFSRKSTTTVPKSGLEVLGGPADEFKSFAVVYPSVVKTRDGKYAQYKWKVHPQHASLLKPPDWFINSIATDPLSAFGRGSGRGNENVGENDVLQPVDLKQVQRMIACIDPNILTYDDWLRIGMALHANDQSPESLQIWDKWSQRGRRYKARECDDRWRGFRGGGVTIGTLFHFANKSGWTPESGDTGVSERVLRIHELNETYAYMVVGGQGRILRLRDKPSPNAPRYDLMTINAFEGLLRSERVSTGEKKMPLSQAWMESPFRRVYENGLGMYPNGKAPEGVFNTWSGLAVSPKEGDCSLFLNHVKNVICDGDEAATNWVLDWLADLVQDPANPKGTAIVMRGPEGCGKGTFANTICEFFGPHSIHLIDESHLTGKFNAHLIDAVVLFADEITWGGNKKTDGKLKGLVSERQLVSERKGMDAETYTNHVHMLVASNSEWVIPAGPGSRRWTVLDVSGKHRSDSSYFGPIHQELDNGGREALLYFLMNRETKSNLRSPYETVALREQRALSASTPDKLFEFVREWLNRGEVYEAELATHNDRGRCMVKATMFELYRQYVKDAGGRALSETSFWKGILKVFPNAKGGSREWPRIRIHSGNVARLMVLGERPEMIRTFANHYGVGHDGIDDPSADWEVCR